MTLTLVLTIGFKQFGPWPIVDTARCPAVLGSQSLLSGTAALAT
jgi:hypothetical protein